MMKREGGGGANERQICEVPGGLGHGPPGNFFISGVIRTLFLHFQAVLLIV